MQSAPAGQHSLSAGLAGEMREAEFAGTFNADYFDQHILTAEDVGMIDVGWEEWERTAAMMDWSQLNAL